MGSVPSFSANDMAPEQPLLGVVVDTHPGISEEQGEPLIVPKKIFQRLAVFSELRIRRELRQRPFFHCFKSRRHLGAQLQDFWRSLPFCLLLELVNLVVMIEVKFRLFVLGPCFTKIPPRMRIAVRIPNERHSE